jgi:hypothetical protein
MVVTTLPLLFGMPRRLAFSAMTTAIWVKVGTANKNTIRKDVAAFISTTSRFLECGSYSTE